MKVHFTEVVHVYADDLSVESACGTTWTASGPARSNSSVEAPLVEMNFRYTGLCICFKNLLGAVVCEIVIDMMYTCDAVVTAHGNGSKPVAWSNLRDN